MLTIKRKMRKDALEKKMTGKVREIIPGERNRGIDIIRAGCTLLIMLYHVYALLDFPVIPVEFADLFLRLGGEIGVTGFFILSGYGIYCSLNCEYEKTGKISYGKYLKKRAIRILPQYYVNIFLLLCISGSARIGTFHDCKVLGIHLFCMQGFLYAGRGMINGVFWSVSIIVQFYLIAPLLFRIIKRSNPVLTAVGGSVFTIACKRFLLHYTAWNGFFGSRQLFSSLDNFLLGMFLAWIWQNQKKRLNPAAAFTGCIMVIPLLLRLCEYGGTAGIHTDNFSGYTWHTFLAWGLLFLFWLFMQIPVNEKNPVNKGILWIAKYEYGIFLWHLCIEKKLIGEVPFAWLWDRNLYLPAIALLFAVIIIFSWFMTVAVDECMVPRIKEIKREIRREKWEK